MRHLKKFEDISADDLFLQHTNDFARDKQVITNQDDDNVNDEENSDIDEKPWGDEDDSSLNYSDKSKNSISSFNDFDCDSCDNDETDEYNPENDDDFGAIRADGSDNLGYDNDEEEEEEEEDDKPWDENIKLERFSTFNEKKKAAKKDEDKDSKKPDFKDFDGDGDKKEPMTKALKDKEDKEDKGGKKFEKPKKGEIPAALKKYQDKKKKK
jgi:hypothetical protein